MSVASARHVVFRFEPVCCAGDDCQVDDDDSSGQMIVVLAVDSKGRPTGKNAKMFHEVCYSYLEDEEHKSAIERVGGEWCDVRRMTLNPTVVALSKHYGDTMIAIKPARGFFPTSVADEKPPFVMVLEKLDVKVDRFVSVRDVSTFLHTLSVSFAGDSSHKQARLLGLGKSIKAFFDAWRITKCDVTWWLTRNEARGNAFDVVVYDRSSWLACARYDKVLHAENGTWSKLVPVKDRQFKKILAMETASRQIIDALVDWLSQKTSRENDEATVGLVRTIVPTSVVLSPGDGDADIFNIYRNCSMVMMNSRQRRYGVLDRGENHVPELLLFSGVMSTDGPVVFFVHSDHQLAGLDPSNYVVNQAQVLDSGTCHKSDKK